MTKFKVEVLTVNVDQLKVRNDNPRTINRKEYDALKKSIRDFPEMKELREIVVDEDMNILAGTQRYNALQDLGYADITVKKAIGLTEKQKKRFMALDNHHSGKWDMDIIANEWDVAEFDNWGITGFDFGDIADDEPQPTTAQPKEKEPIVCPNCGMEIEV